MVISLLIFAALHPLNFYGQNNNVETYSVIKEYFTQLKSSCLLDINQLGFKPKGISFDEVLSRKIYVHNPHVDADIDTVLSAEDFGFMKQQLEQFKNSSGFDQEMLTRHHIPFPKFKKPIN